MKFNIKPQYRPYIIGGVAAIVIYYLLFKRKNLIKRQEIQTGQELATSELTEAATYPPSQYSTWANQLETAMEDVGTDEDTIKSIFKNLQNNTDYLKLYTAFGSREYSGGWTPDMFGEDWDLGQWLVEELDSSEITEINNDLSSKGITYRIS
jgi:hypothetical protein